jgi:hypothetical protein
VKTEGIIQYQFNAARDPETEDLAPGGYVALAGYPRTVFVSKEEAHSALMKHVSQLPQFTGARPNRISVPSDEDAFTIQDVDGGLWQFRFAETREAVWMLLWNSDQSLESRPVAASLRGTLR